MKNDLISRTWLLAEYDKRHNGPPGGARKLIEEAPSALGTNLAEVGTDCISRQAAIEVIDSFNVFESRGDQIKLEQMIGELPPASNSGIPNSSDTISRAKAIDGKICIRRSNGVEIYDDYVVPVEYLEQLPPAQPEIIRCKDCKYNATSKKCLNPNSFFLVPADDDFCSYAERREVQDENDKTTNNTTNA